MAEKKFDFDLCRKILLRLEELLAVPDANKPTQYVFDGYRNSDVAHYIKKMGDDDIIHVKLRSEHEYDHLQCWPIGFREKGRSLSRLRQRREDLERSDGRNEGAHRHAYSQKDEDSFEGSHGGVK